VAVPVGVLAAVDVACEDAVRVAEAVAVAEAV